MLEMIQEAGMSQLKAKIPVAEHDWMVNYLRSSTEGRGHLHF
jgi:translation elongation factor EF-G